MCACVSVNVNVHVCFCAGALQDTEFATIQDAVRRFDLTFVQNYWDGNDCVYSFHPHCAASGKGFVLAHSRAKMSRIAKYLARGYTVSFDKVD